LIAQLENAGEHPALSEAEIPGRGKWTRVLTGSFPSLKAAAAYAHNLVKRGVIKEFLVRSAAEPGFDFRRQITQSSNAPLTQSSGRSSGAVVPAKAAQPGARPVAVSLASSRSSSLKASHASYAIAPLPSIPGRGFLRNPNVDAEAAPRPDPVILAFRYLRNALADHRGGLWVSGDVDEAMARLRWIAGPGREDLLNVDSQGQVHINAARLARAAGISYPNVADAPLRLADYISSDEGLLLLAQVIGGDRRYLFHIGELAATLDGDIYVGSTINLDNNFDSRINPFRKNGQKLGRERPRAGFDALIAVNPSAHWTKVSTGQPISDGIITFHELAEAYSKADFGLQYLGKGSFPGAHDIAIEREIKLRSQNRGAGLVITEGINRVFKPEKNLARLRSQLQSPAQSHR
jgi:hypothetical protein